MSDADIPDRTRLPLEMLDQIDRACDRFESAWARGDRPRIEDFLGEVAPPYRRALLRDLLAADITARRRRGEDPQPGEYRDRLAGDDSAVDAAFGLARQTAVASTATATDAGFGLLLGLLAHQTGLIDETALVEALRAWLADKAQPMAEILTRAAPLDDARRAWLEDLAAEHVKLYGDARRSLAAISAGQSTRERLAQLGDADVNATLPHIGSGSRLPDPEAPTRAAGDAAPAPPRGTVVRYFGDYEIREELGRGGMGVVYMARQVSLNRSVALKMIRAGVLADGADLQRFQNEAEAVALLDHAGIVPVYEVGEHDGQRYFSMKLVEGGNLAEQLPRFRADPRAAAALLAEAAEAVHHAHMRGILHRDLKPANILIDADGRPHVTDFGLAKRVEGDAEMTQSGAILGTPAYMSPEQAAGRRGAITTATDVYGLGAILYALLAGRAPFGGDGAIETLDAVRTRPPEAPTARNPGVPRDLETVCLKCLEKDPRKRYASAHALADDLNNWLDSRPITARRVGPAERAWLWCKRRPALASLAAALVVALIAGGATTTVMWLRAERNYRNELAAKSRAQAQQERAEAREQQAIVAVRSFADAVSESPELRNNPGLGPLRRTLLKRPLDFFKSLRDQLQADRDTRPAALARLAAAEYDLGALTDQIGDRQDALTAFREALSIRRRLSDADPANVAYRRDLGHSHHDLARLLSVMTKTEEARASCRDALAIFRKLAGDHPDVGEFRHFLANTHHNHADLLADVGESGEAVAEHERAMAIWQELVDVSPGVAKYRNGLADSHNNLGMMMRQLGRMADAEAEYRRALATYEELARGHPDVAAFRNNLAGSHNNLAGLLTETGRPDKARAQYRAAATVMQKLVDDHPTVTGFRLRLADCRNDLGMLLWQLSEMTQAEAEYRRALQIYRKLAEDNPKATVVRSNLGGSLNNLAGLLSGMGRSDEAEAVYGLAKDVLQKLVDDVPTLLGARTRLADSHNNFGLMQWRLGRFAEAEAESRRALAIYRKLVDDHPDVPAFRSDLAGSLSRIGTIQQRSRRAAEAVDSYRNAVALMEQIPVLTPGSRYNLACFRALLAGVAAEPGSGMTAAEGRAEADGAMDDLRRAVAGGYRNLALMQNDADLDPLRVRPDFRLLMMDLAMPTDPFAR